MMPSSSVEEDVVASPPPPRHDDNHHRHPDYNLSSDVITSWTLRDDVVVPDLVNGLDLTLEHPDSAAADHDVATTFADVEMNTTTKMEEGNCDDDYYSADHSPHYYYYSNVVVEEEEGVDKNHDHSH